MTSIPPGDVTKLHEQSLRRLDAAQEEVTRVREMLRKAVVRLSIAARCEDDQLNRVLDQVKATVKSDIDLGRLDGCLDKLLVEINRPGAGARKPLPVFHVRLQQGLDGAVFSPSAEPYRKRIQDLIDEKLPDSEIAGRLIALVNDVAAGAGDRPPDDTAARANADAGDTPAGADCTAEDITENLMALLDNLNLPESTRNDHRSVCRQLDSQPKGTERWKSLIDGIGALVNKSIFVLQDEKKDLQEFIKKMTDKLAEIDQYVRQSRQDRIDTANESTRLMDTVDTNVTAIQQTFGAADDIGQLKHDLEDHLAEIRRRVEEHQRAETEREELSKKGYAHIIGELARTQKETLMLREQLQESQQKMLRDPLTGCPNRLAYEERIAVEINRSKRNHAPLCVAMWDIDHFKKVNDTYGHDAGDRVLKLLSKIITSRVRKVDMFARIGGEEFVLLMPDTAIDDALNLNNELRQSLEQSGFHYKGSPCPITSSVGIAALEDYDTPEQILYRADKALYQSKRNGRNRCTVYTPNS